jgi:hypothetical protein
VLSVRDGAVKTSKHGGRSKRKVPVLLARITMSATTRMATSTVVAPVMMVSSGYHHLHLVDGGVETFHDREGTSEHEHMHDQ